VPRPLAAIALTALTVATVAACTGDGGESGSTSTGDPSVCPGDVVRVVVSVGQWGDIVGSLAGDCADVTTIVASGSVDPHDFEPGTADLAAFSDADLVVVNGAGYDSWALDAVDTLDERPELLVAAEVSTAPNEDEDPHLWYDPRVVPAVASRVSEALQQQSPDAGEYFQDRELAWEEELQPYLDAVEDLRAVAEGRTYAATETVFDRMAAAIGLSDVTPEDYRRAVSNESEPPPGAIAEFEELLREGRADVLVVNRQTSGSLVEQLTGAAEDQGVPAVGVTESPPEPGSSFVEWQLAQLEELRAALEGNR
jgi:zinc/manganese transport system substrate-binding protein